MTRLGSMRSSARTPRRPRPSFLPSFLLSSLLFASAVRLSYSFGNLPLSLSASSPFLQSLFLLVSLFPSLFVPLFLSFPLGCSFPRVSSSVLSRRAADADAGASGIAATVSAATHTLHFPSLRISPRFPSFALRHPSFVPLYSLFEKQRRWPSAQRTRR